MFLYWLSSRERRRGLDLEPNTWDVSNGVTLSSEPGYQHFIVFFDVVERSVSRYEGGDFLAVFNQLDTNTLSDGRVRLFGLNANLFQNNSLGVRGTTEWIGFQSCSQVRFFVILVIPYLNASMISKLASSSNTTRGTFTHSFL